MRCLLYVLREFGWFMLRMLALWLCVLLSVHYAFVWLIGTSPTGGL